MAQSSEKDSFLLIWRIENFSMCPQIKAEGIKTPDFKVFALDETTWHMRLYPKGDSSTDGDCVSCYLYRAKKEQEAEKISISYAIKAVSLDTKSLTLSSDWGTFEKGHGYGYRELVTLQHLAENKHKFLLDDTLTVACVMRPQSEIDRKETIDIPASNVDKNLAFQETLTFRSGIRDWRKTGVCNWIVSTRIPVQKSEVVWVIDDFKARMQSGEKMAAMTVETRLHGKPRLLAVHCHLKQDWNGERLLSVTVRRKDADFQQMYVRCKVSVVDKSGAAQNVREDDHHFGKDYNLWSISPIMKMSAIESLESELLVDGALTLRCEFLVSYKSKYGGICNQTNEEIATGFSQQDISDLLTDSPFIYATLISEGTEVLVHKSIICARSPVFKAMFSNDTEEKRTGIVRIPDIDAGTLQEMVNFIYRDEIPDLQPEEAMKLYAAADKYEILKLKEACAASLMGDLSLVNMCDILQLADLHQDEKLLEYVQNFMYARGKDVFESPQWDELMEDNIQLAGETMRMVLKRALV